MPTAENVRTAIANARRMVIAAGVVVPVVDDLVANVAARCAQRVVEFVPSLPDADPVLVEALRVQMVEQCAQQIQREFGL